MVPMLTGLLSSLLSGMEEPDETIQKTIMDVMAQINRSVGDKFYLSTLWYILLKNSKNRIATFKILFKKFQDLDSKKLKDSKGSSGQLIDSKSGQLPEQAEGGERGMSKLPGNEAGLHEITENIVRTDGKVESFYPNTWMITNALIKCLDLPVLGQGTRSTPPIRSFAAKPNAIFFPLRKPVFATKTLS